MAFPRNYLRFVGAMSVVFGLLYLFAPESMTGPTGFGALPPGGMTDVRATYGGLQLGFGAFLLWAAADTSRTRFALVLVALTIGAVAASRLLGLLWDGSANAFHITALPTEVTLTALAVLALHRTPSVAAAPA